MSHEYSNPLCPECNMDARGGILHYAHCSQEKEMQFSDDVKPEVKIPSQLLPTDPKARKAIPLVTGCLDYFPLALAEVAKVSVAGNAQHNPGKPLHWDKSKSTDHADTIGRHLAERGTVDSDGQRHSAKLAWRALALLQTELENEKS